MFLGSMSIRFQFRLEKGGWGSHATISYCSFDMELVNYIQQNHSLLGGKTNTIID